MLHTLAMSLKVEHNMYIHLTVRYLKYTMQSLCMRLHSNFCVTFSWKATVFSRILTWCDTRLPWSVLLRYWKKERQSLTCMDTTGNLKWLSYNCFIIKCSRFKGWIYLYSKCLPPKGSERVWRLKQWQEAACHATAELPGHVARGNWHADMKTCSCSSTFRK